MPWTRTLTPEQLAWIRRQDRAGKSRSEIADTFEQRFGQAISRQRLSRLLAPAHRKIRPPDTIRLSVELTANEAQFVRAYAARMGYVAKTGQTVGEGSIPELLRAVAAGEVELVRPRRNRKTV